MSPPVLMLSDISKRFHQGLRTVQALDRVSLQVQAGETVGIVGESGCGKSTVARAALRLLDVDAGQVLWQGQEVTRLSGAALRPWRPRVQMVFQDPSASLNPRSTVQRLLEEPLRVQRRGDAAERQARVLQALARVGLGPEAAARYPHEFSGGQRQRIGIARALMLEPDLVVCDEAVSALDVSIRAQILNLLLRLRAELGSAYLFISHDLGVVRHLADRVVVMYLGQVVENAPRDALWREPLHPYTQALMATVPRRRPPPGTAPPTRPALQGELPSPLNPPTGCRFHPHCPQAQARCREQAPALRVAAGTHHVACHLIHPH